jgi:hypothetical protein
MKRRTRIQLIHILPFVTHLELSSLNLIQVLLSRMATDSSFVPGDLS